MLSVVHASKERRVHSATPSQQSVTMWVVFSKSLLAWHICQFQCFRKRYQLLKKSVQNVMIHLDYHSHNFFISCTDIP